MKVSVLSVLITQYHSGDINKTYDMGGAYGTCGGQERGI